MAFVEIKGFPGRLFVPDENVDKKHPCADCFACQFCSDERCGLCLSKKHGGFRPLITPKKDYEPK
ncbi:MAG: hypothetical protein MUD12_09995 [Spirochaetes bacterium]|jgi:hypothetical protein|nr:hypothetical protein [Spirochaetota bacterium]